MPEDERPPPAADLSGSGWLELLAAGRDRDPGAGCRGARTTPFSPTVRLGEAEQRCRLQARPGRATALGLSRRPVSPRGRRLRAVRRLGLDSCPRRCCASTGRMGKARCSASSTPISPSTTSRFCDEPRHHAQLATDRRLSTCWRTTATARAAISSSTGRAESGGSTMASASTSRPSCARSCGTLPARSFRREMLAACEDVSKQVPETVAALLEPDECQALKRRAVSILRKGRFPSPREDYRAYPWPLV